MILIVKCCEQKLGRKTTLESRQRETVESCCHISIDTVSVMYHVGMGDRVRPGCIGVRMARLAGLVKKPDLS